MQKEFEVPDADPKSTISLSLKIKHIELLKKYKDRKGVSVSAIIDKLIEDYLPKDFPHKS